jgi:hypothetical protein
MKRALGGPGIGAVLAGVVIGGVAGLFLAGILTVIGSLLTLWSSLDGGNAGLFEHLLVPAELGIVIGAAIGGLIGLRRARRSPKVLSEMPARPDTT